MELKRDTPEDAPPRSVDAVVVGGGHAGIEAAVALARGGLAVALVTFDVTGLGRMSCNPSIGGLAKGQLVREIDVLGGWMGRLADRAGIHFRMLNRRKGPAVRAPRAQVDTPTYTREAQRALCAISTVQVIEGEVTDIRVTGGRGAARRVCGVRVARRARRRRERPSRCGSARSRRSRRAPSSWPPGRFSKACSSRAWSRAPAGVAPRRRRMRSRLRCGASACAWAA